MNARNRAFSARVTAALQAMYDRAASRRNGLLSPVAISRGRDLLLELGYPEELLARVPPALLEYAFPCANPLPRIAAAAPESLLDLGCGAGFDLLFAALSPNPPKKLLGLENSSGLRARSRELRRCFPELARRIRIMAGDFTRLEETVCTQVDLILMNGSFNLVFDKPRFLREAARRLLPGGRLLLCDFLLIEPLPEGFAADPDNWLWNIAGALPAEELTSLAAKAGFRLAARERLETIAPVARTILLFETSGAL